jgi:hypothetical protein
MSRDRRAPTTPIERGPIDPARVRRIDGSFTFLPHRFLRDGFFVSLTRNELALYVFLLLAGDRNGISFYGYDRICSILEIPLDDYIDARNALLRMDLIAFDGFRFQVLSLPEPPRSTRRVPMRDPADLADRDPATVRQTIAAALRRTPGT